MNVLNFYTCPFCTHGKGGIQLDTSLLPAYRRNHPKKQKVAICDELPFGAITFGGKTEACEHLFNMEMFLNRGFVDNDGLMKTDWSTRFGVDSPPIQDCEPGDIALDFLYEEVYLRTEAVRQPEFRLAIPHVVTGWIEYRFNQSHCKESWWDLQFNGFFAEDVTQFFRELNRLASVRQERWKHEEGVC